MSCSGPSRDGDAAAACCETDVAVIRRHTQAPIVLLVAGGAPGLVEAAFAAGVDDVLVLPQRPETIAFAIRKARETGGRPARTADERHAARPRA